MIDDDQPHNGGDANIDSTVWRMVEINSTRGRVRDVIQHLILQGEVPV